MVRLPASISTAPAATKRYPPPVSRLLSHLALLRLPNIRSMSKNRAHRTVLDITEGKMPTSSRAAQHTLTASKTIKPHSMLTEAKAAQAGWEKRLPTILKQLPPEGKALATRKHSVTNTMKPRAAKRPTAPAIWAPFPPASTIR